jgi:crossover junction endodeoxyribonuclease RuvC
MYDLIVGIDPGIGGAIAILDLREQNIVAGVFSTPTKNIIKNKKKKKDYDIEAMANILEKYRTYKILVVQEATHAMPGQGTTSMYAFGRGAGIWEGIVAAYHMNQIFVSPMTWKTEWSDELFKKIDKPEMLKLKPAEVNKLSATDRKKYKEIKKEYKKDMDKAKKLSKDKARELAGKLYPELKDCFELKKDDGKAESLLIAEYMRRHIND